MDLLQRESYTLSSLPPLDRFELPALPRRCMPHLRWCSTKSHTDKSRDQCPEKSLGRLRTKSLSLAPFTDAPPAPCFSPCPWAFPRRPGIGGSAPANRSAWLRTVPTTNPL